MRRFNNSSKFFLSLTCILTVLFLNGSLHAASYCVDSLSDGPPNAGDCSSVCNSTPTCTLRDAIEAANADPIADTIVFGIDGKIELSGVSGNDDNSSGDLDILQSVTLTGNDAALTVIDGSGLDRIFDILTPGINVEISNLTVQNGNLGTPSGGAGIQNQANLILENLMIAENQITAPINSANQGGGVLNSGDLTLQNSTISGNSAEAGGGLVNFGTALITQSTFSGNDANIVGGGGIANSGAGDLTLVNTTLSGNTTPGFGGGLYNDATSALFNVTIANNSANTDNDGSGDGGGITVGFFNNSLSMTHTISAGNQVGTGAANPDCYTLGDPVVSGGFNMVEDLGNCTGFIGSDPNGENPNLGPLGSNGGSTPTQPLLAGSPAIDAGNPAGCEDQNGDPLTQDQRASLRPVDGLSNGGTAICDIGATEFGADVAVTKFDNPDPVEPEQEFSYTIQVTNNGPDAAQGVVVTDKLPTEVTFQWFTSVAQCQHSGRDVTCNIGTLASGKVVSIVIQVTAPNEEISFKNTASVTSLAGDYNLANNTSAIETGVQFEEDNSGCALGGGIFPSGAGMLFILWAGFGFLGMGIRFKR